MKVLSNLKLINGLLEQFGHESTFVLKYDSGWPTRPPTQSPVVWISLSEQTPPNDAEEGDLYFYL